MFIDRPGLYRRNGYFIDTFQKLHELEGSTTVTSVETNNTKLHDVRNASPIQEHLVNNEKVTSNNLKRQ